MEQIVAACAEAKQHSGSPTVIIANTVKGKGVSFMENNYIWHSKVPTDQELAIALDEIAKGV